MRTALARRRPSGGGGGGGTVTSFLTATNWARPVLPVGGAFGRDIPFTTKAQLDAAVANMIAGDYIRYVGSTPLTLSASGGNAYALTGKNPSGPVVFDFGCSHNQWDASKITPGYVNFRYTGTSSFNGFYVNACSNIHIFGGDYSSGSSGGTGFLCMGNTHDCHFWDMYIHDCGTGGLGFLPKDGGTGVNSTIDNVSVRAEVNVWGLDLAADSHVQAPGTGLHACLTGDAGGGFTNNAIAIHGHDAPACGCVLEMGSTLAKGNGVIGNNTFYVKAEHLHFASTQTASNGVNIWGDKDYGTNVFGWLEGNDLYGHPMHYAGGTLTGMVVNHGRHSNTEQNTSDSQIEPFPQGRGVIYNDTDYP